MFTINNDYYLDNLLTMNLISAREIQILRFLFSEIGSADMHSTVTDLGIDTRIRRSQQAIRVQIKLLEKQMVPTIEAGSLDNRVLQKMVQLLRKWPPRDSLLQPEK